jgi:hypothetical protein
MNGIGCRVLLTKGKCRNRAPRERKRNHPATGKDPQQSSTPPA